jgi:hypothetical protein
MAEARRLGYGEDGGCFDHRGDCRDGAHHKTCAGRWCGVVSLGFSADGNRVRRKVSAGRPSQSLTLEQATALLAAERTAGGEQWQESGLVFTTSVGTAYESHNLRRDFRRVTERPALRLWIRSSGLGRFARLIRSVVDSPQCPGM